MQDPDDRDRGLAEPAASYVDGVEGVAPTAEGFPDRLKSLVGDRPLEQFARDTGLDRTLLRKYLNGAEPGMSKLAAIANAAHVSLDWLITGRSGSQTAHEALDARKLLAEEPASVLVQLGRLRREDRERTLVEAHPIRDGIALRGDIARGLAGSAEVSDLAWFPVHGDAMAPALREGDIAVVRMGEPTELRQDHVYLLDWRTPGRPHSLFRACWQRDGRLALVSDNPAARAQDPDPFPGRPVDGPLVVGEVVARFGRP